MQSRGLLDIGRSSARSPSEKKMLRRSGCCWVSRPCKTTAFAIFRKEQLQTNKSLQDLSAIQKQKVIAKIFKGLSRDDIAMLKQRAAAEAARIDAAKRAASSFVKLSAYQYFFQDQLQHNPAILTLRNPRDREVKLLQIFETLPVPVREALELKAEEYNQLHQRVAEKVSASRAASAIHEEGKKIMAERRQRSGAAVKKGKKKVTAVGAATQKTAAKFGGTGKRRRAAKSGAGKVQQQVDEARAATRTKRRRLVKPSTYALFVQRQMSEFRHLAPKERMREIAKRWRAMSDLERTMSLSPPLLLTESTYRTTTLSSSSVSEPTLSTRAPLRNQLGASLSLVNKAALPADEKNPDRQCSSPSPAPKAELANGFVAAAADRSSSSPPNHLSF